MEVRDVLTTTVREELHGAAGVLPMSLSWIQSESNSKAIRSQMWGYWASHIWSPTKQGRVLLRDSVVTSHAEIHSRSLEVANTALMASHYIYVVTAHPVWICQLRYKNLVRQIVAF